MQKYSGGSCVAKPTGCLTDQDCEPTELCVSNTEGRWGYCDAKQDGTGGGGNVAGTGGGGGGAGGKSGGAGVGGAAGGTPVGETCALFPTCEGKSCCNVTFLRLNTQKTCVDPNSSEPCSLSLPEGVCEANMAGCFMIPVKGQNEPRFLVPSPEPKDFAFAPCVDGIASLPMCDTGSAGGAGAGGAAGVGG